MYIVIFGIFPIMVSSQVLVTDLIDAVNSEGKLIKYIEEKIVPKKIIAFGLNPATIKPSL